MGSNQDSGILIAQRSAGKSLVQSFLRPDKANRHGLISGATGTGKTITLQTLAEGFSARGVPVFMADVKGDLSGLSEAGALGGKLAKVLKERGLMCLNFQPARPPCGMFLACWATRCAPP